MRTQPFPGAYRGIDLRRVRTYLPHQSLPMTAAFPLSWSAAFRTHDDHVQARSRVRGTVTQAGNANWKTSTVQAAVEAALAAISQTEAYRGWGRSHGCRRACPRAGGELQTDRGLSPRSGFMNAHLPSDISALSVDAVPEHFHADIRYRQTYGTTSLNRSGGRLCCGNEPGLFTNHSMSPRWPMPQPSCSARTISPRLKPRPPTMTIRTVAYGNRHSAGRAISSCAPSMPTVSSNRWCAVSLGRWWTWDAANDRRPMDHNSQGPLPPLQPTGRPPPMGCISSEWIMTRHPLLPVT